MGQIFSVRQSVTSPTYHSPDYVALELDRDLDKTHIAFRNSNLTEPPNVSEYLHLEELDLGSNELTTPPDMRQNTELKCLFLNKNQLTQASDTRQNGKLEMLDLSDNRLSYSPDLSQNPKLNLVDLSNNCLTELHDSIFSLDRDCIVLIFRNHFTMDYLHQLDERLVQYRAEYPGQGPRILCAIYRENFQALCP